MAVPHDSYTAHVLLASLSPRACSCQCLPWSTLNLSRHTAFASATGYRAAPVQDSGQKGAISSAGETTFASVAVRLDSRRARLSGVASWSYCVLGPVAPFVPHRNRPFRGLKHSRSEEGGGHAHRTGVLRCI